MYQGHQLGRPSSNAWKNPTADVAEIRAGATTICMGHILDLGDMSIGERPAGNEQKNTADKVGAMCQCRVCMYRRPSNSGKAILEVCAICRRVRR